MDDETVERVQRRLRHRGPVVPANQVFGGSTWQTTDSLNLYRPSVLYTGNTSQANYVSAASLLSN